MSCRRCEAVRKTAIDAVTRIAALARAKRLRSFRISRQRSKTRGPDHPIWPAGKPSA
jgi:hypothetical protein